MEAQGTIRRALSDLPNFFSILVFMAVTAVLFRSWQFALVVTASLGFHELGHAAALSWYGSEWRITFGIVGAWTWSPLPARERLSQLANVIIHLCGPLFSLLLALIALGLQNIWHPVDRHLLTLANFSAQVGLLNLLPLGSLTDGGKIVRRMISSLDSSRRKWMAILPISVTLLMVVVYGLVEAPHIVQAQSTPFMLGLLLVGVWMASSMLIEGLRAADIRSQKPAPESPLTTGQVVFLLLVLWDLLVLGLIITEATPFWLTPAYVLGSLRNLVSLLHLLRQLTFVVSAL